MHTLGDLLDQREANKILPPGSMLAGDAYLPSDGMQWRAHSVHGDLVQDIARISDGALLLSSNYSPLGELRQEQTVKEGDLIHIQFRLSGGGDESLSGSTVLATPSRSCIVSRYPVHSTLERRIEKDDRWKFACLLITPQALATLLDVSAAQLPDAAQWIAREGSLELQSRIVPLQSMMILAVNEIFSCPLKGQSRRAYMRGKALELLSLVVYAIEADTRTEPASAVQFTRSDLARIAEVKDVLAANLGSSWTLATLARRAGVNRTKLALGFKHLGDSPQIERVCHQGVKSIGRNCDYFATAYGRGGALQRFLLGLLGIDFHQVGSH